MELECHPFVCHFPLKVKEIHITVGDSKLDVGMNASLNACLCVCTMK